jgi:acetoin utilization protein AcuC
VSTGTGSGSVPVARVQPSAVLVHAVRRRQRPYRGHHPLAIPRTALAFDLIRAFGALDDAETIAGRAATPDEACAFHTPDYVQALLDAERSGGLCADARARFGLGGVENPYFDDLYAIPATATGGSLQGADAVIAGQAAFNPAGGMHHARAGAAQGFCYLNDPVLAVLRLKRAGLRVLYVDIDAHHGDGVEIAFAEDPDVLTLSLHMDPAYAYPFRGGRLRDAGSPVGGHATVNVPLPRGTTDAEYHHLLDAVLPPLARAFAPDAVVLQAGADAIFADPLGKLALTTQGYLAAVARVLAIAPRTPQGVPRILVTGGGGYHPIVVARAWTGVWALLSGRDLPDAIPPAGAAALRAAAWDRDADAPHYARLFTHRSDAPPDAGNAIRDDVRRLADAARAHPFLDRGG